MSILDRIRRAPPPSVKSSDDLNAYYLSPDGELSPLKSTVKTGWGNSGGYGGVAYSQYSDRPINSTPQGYAMGYIASVWAFRSVEIRASSVARMDWFVQVKSKPGKSKAPYRAKPQAERIESHPLHLALKRSPDPLLRKLEWSRMVWGETFLLPLQNEFGYYSDIQWLNNLGVAINIMPGYIHGFMYTPIYGGKPHIYAPNQVCYLKTDNPFNDLRGLSKIETVLLEVGIDRDIARRTKAFYANDARLGLLLIPEADMSPENAQAFMDYFRTNTQGAKNAGQPILLPRNIKDIKEVQRAPNIDDKDIRESMRREICAAFGVPLSIVGAWDDANYQSAPEQRKSLYEETIIPECETLKLELNQHLVPFFDDPDKVEIDFDPSQILALTEDTKGKQDTFTRHLLSGAITLNEFRENLEMDVLPQGNVFYVPNNIVVTPAAQLGLMPPPAPAQPFGGASQALPGMIASPPSLPTPARGALLLPPLTAETKSVEDELEAWYKKARQSGATKALRFVCYKLPDEVQVFVRRGLGEAGDRDAIRQVFAHAREMVKKKSIDEPPVSATPEEYLAYWGRYDTLMNELGNAWIDDYMTLCWASLEAHPQLSDTDLTDALGEYHGTLVDSWVGSADAPGTLAKVMLAGMVAGQEALEKPQTDLNPMKAISLNIDWSLLSQQALDFIRSYTFDLIRRLDDTTREAVRKAMDAWTQSGEGMDALKEALYNVFHDRARADAIAVTEATRAYHEGAIQRWQEAGVTRARWQTVQDGDVCLICQPLHNQEADLAQGWFSEVLGDYVQPPSHVNCRCYSRPVIS